MVNNKDIRFQVHNRSTESDAKQSEDCGQQTKGDQKQRAVEFGAQQWLLLEVTLECSASDRRVVCDCHHIIYLFHRLISIENQF